MIGPRRKPFKKMMAEMFDHGGLVYLARKHGIVRLVDLAIDFVLTTIRENLYKPRVKGYGLIEALLFPKAIDYYTRYIDVAEAILKYFPKGASILDVGAGIRGGISFFLRQPNYRIMLLDRNQFDRKPWFRQSIIADGGKLPFEDSSFDIVVSVATLEHIPKDARLSFLMELKRVGEMVILHSPCDDEDEGFLGRRYDFLFQYYHKQILGIEDQKTGEHIASTHPSISELRTVFPRSKIIGRKNCDVWLKYMVFSRRPIIGHLAGLIYVLFLKKDNKPPCYECMLTDDKNKSRQF